MKTLSSQDFHTFFEDVHGYEPFPWQQRLTDAVLAEGKWPDVIALPTGTGKTAILDTAVFALAARPEISPRRTVFVIDRRIVVDQVYERAELIAKRIESAATPTLRSVRNALHSISDGKSLHVSALRGGIPIDSEWTHHPEQPQVMVSTVDQFGSRLLFRGYGVTARMRPVQAGLSGNDCLVILDEVHLSIPFAETLQQVSRLATHCVPKRFFVVKMSATPSRNDVERFTLHDDDMECEELRRRVTAPKTAELVSIRNENVLPTHISRMLKQTRTSNARRKTRQSAMLWDVEAEGKSVGVVVNRVKTARNIHRELVEAGIKAHLITGRMRPLDRVSILDAVTPLVQRTSR